MDRNNFPRSGTTTTTGIHSINFPCRFIHTTPPTFPDAGHSSPRSIDLWPGTGWLVLSLCIVDIIFQQRAGAGTDINTPECVMNDTGWNDTRYARCLPARAPDLDVSSPIRALLTSNVIVRGPSLEAYQSEIIVNERRDFFFEGVENSLSSVHDPAIINGE